MSQTGFIWIVIVAACVAANLPFLNHRILALGPVRAPRKALWMRLISSTSSSLGNERCWCSRSGEAETVGSQSPVSQRVRLPAWVSWIIRAQPCRWMRAANSCSTGMIRSWLMSIWPNEDGLSAATLDEPPNMVSARPPLAFSSW